MNSENAIWKHVSKAITIITIVWLSNPIPKNVERRYIQKCAYLHTHTHKKRNVHKDFSLGTSMDLNIRDICNLQEQEIGNDLKV